MQPRAATFAARGCFCSDFELLPARPTDENGVSAFGPTPIPQTPGAVQASLIAQQANAPRPREKTKAEEAAASRRAVIRDEVRLSDPGDAQPVDIKPDAAEEWKHRRPGAQGKDDRPSRLDLQA